MEMKIYITNLAQYNNSRLIGEWVDLTQVTQNELDATIKKILGRDEEYFITDYESPFKISEYQNIQELYEFAQQTTSLAEYEQAALYYLIDFEGYTFEDAINKYSDVTAYEANTIEDLAEQFVDEGLYGEIPKQLQYYIDYEAIGRDLEMDYCEIVFNNTTYFIDRNSY